MQVVYVARNPKDVIVSYYYHHKLIKLQSYTGTLDDFAEYFMNDEGESIDIPILTIFGAYFKQKFEFQHIVAYAPFFPHILDAWSKRHHPNMHFMFYEDMKRV